ncbi:MAG: hypothetical protein Q7T82_07885 [Armatimonadota bacterium]|nr:hypothetical protein [Armatimonadota bacterium]
MRFILEITTPAWSVARNDVARQVLAIPELLLDETVERSWIDCDIADLG